MAECIHRTTCRLCHSHQVELGVHFEPTPPGDVYVSKDQVSIVQRTFPLDLYACQSCGSVQLLDVVNPEILYGNYIYQTSFSLGLPDHFKQYVDEVLSLTGVKSGGLVIDIGSNDGTLLKCFQERGMKVLGIDPAPAAGKIANERGVQTLQALFSKTMGEMIRRERGAVSMVTANNVIANIDDLDDLVQGIRALIEPDGFFVFETGYGLDLFEHQLIDVVYHEHLSYFTIGPLAKFFRRHGMKMAHAQYIATKGGSIRCVIVSEESTFKTSDLVKQMVLNEEKKGMGQKILCQQLSQFIAHKKKELDDFLNGLRQKGGTIAGYGASVGVTTLMYLFGLDKKLDFLVDDNPRRFGLFTPGHHLPVYSSQELYTRKPDYVLVLAWRYAQPILKRHQPYMDMGGRFIHFLPDLK